ncbi:MAG TPA: 23S rRNA (guanosine(2251)-2'-O)-methyltransferase RlmB [Jiangellales bacterium]|nr:23S rRNA (guanosine(2251)-2'-O)-methyltransferase RlmB [Jiangellales bacterium]
MAGNSQRRGAKRNPGSKKGAVVGSGGQRRKQLKGKGPTPRAEERVGHVAARRSSAAQRRSGAGDRRDSGRARGAGRSGAAGTTEMVAGRNAVVEALRAGIPVKVIYVAERIDSDDRVREVLRTAADRGFPLLESPRPELDRLTGGAVHQGVALAVPPYDYAHPDDLVARAREAGEVPLLVALDGVTDPRNLGAVVRSAAAFGAHGVVVPERRSAGMTAGAWKTSAGAAARVPVARATNLARQLRSYAQAGLFVVGLAAEGEVAVDELAAADEPLCVVVGSEGHGLSRVVTQACDTTVRIPMAGEVESLNAGVAAGIALYAVVRARRAAG